MKASIFFLVITIIGIIIVLQTDHKLEIDISRIIFNSAYPREIQICIRIYSLGNCSQIIHIRNDTE